MTIRTALRQPWTAVLLAGLAVALALTLAACASGGGGGGGDEDAQALLDRAFETPVPSADLDVDLQFDVEGLAGFDDPLRLRASGPYVRAKGSLPKLDLDVALETQGAGQAIQLGALSTGDRVFVQFAGTYYEQPAAEVARTNRRIARDAGDGGGSLADLGIDARRWVADAQVEGEEEIGGVATEHVSGTLDVRAALEDLNDLVEQSAGSLPDAARAARPLTERQIERLADSVDDPAFDVYVGKDDDVVRRVTLRIDVEVPEEDRKDVGGMTGASIRFSAQLADVGGDQEVRAPRSARPLSDLTTQLGGLSGLAGGLGGDTTSPAPAPDAGDATDPGAGEDGAAALDAFERYSQCLDAADPDDSAAISQCRALLP